MRLALLIPLSLVAVADVARHGIQDLLFSLDLLHRKFFVGRQFLQTVLRQREMLLRPPHVRAVFLVLVRAQGIVRDTVLLIYLLRAYLAAIPLLRHRHFPNQVAPLWRHQDRFA